MASNVNKRRGKVNKKFVRNNTRKVNKNKSQDIRQKLLQRKRKNVVDARDILSRLAKTQDARTKINKLREKSNKTGNNIKPIGKNILRKTDRNGKISLVTNKAKVNSDMNVAIQRQLGLISPPKPTIRRPAIRSTVFHKEPTILKTISNNLSSYKWTNPSASQVIGGISRKQSYDVYPPRRAANPIEKYINLAISDEEMPEEPPIASSSTFALQGTSRVSNIHSRLDSVAQPETHGILAQSRTKVLVPAGHRIVVSNLQNTVSQDDIKELFEDIGELLAARLVRSGVAEVIFKNLKDAQKAVDTYHNRQLDGQPMKCLLVNKRPLNNPTAPALPKPEFSEVSPRKIAVGVNYAAKLTPDLSTIHKALFEKR